MYIDPLSASGGTLDPLKTCYLTVNRGPDRTAGIPRVRRALVLANNFGPRLENSMCSRAASRL